MKECIKDFCSLSVNYAQGFYTLKMSGRRLYIVFILLSFKMFGQVNLVPNSSFEDTVACPTSGGQLYNALNWINPSTSIGSSPDYYNSCNSLSMGVPINAFGNQNARTGNAYAGFYANNIIFPSNYEYVETMLTDSLKKDSTYCVSFYLNLSDNSGYCTNNVGIYFSNSLVTTSTNIILVTPQLLNTNIVLFDTIQWMKLEWQYKALGGEKFVTIGNFNSTFTSDTVHVNGGFAFTYYYIDDVFVGDCPLTNSTLTIIPNIFTPNNDGINDLFKITSSNITSLNCKIYNRWGVLVGDIKSVNGSWDGRTTSGLECIDGVYYYTVTAKGTDDKEYNEKGFIQLIR